MKKTFVILAALASGCAVYADTADITFSSTNYKLDKIQVNLPGLDATVGTKPDTSLSLKDKNGTNVPTNWATSTIAPNVKVNGSSTPWTLTFTLTNNTGLDMTLTGVTVSAFTYDSSANPQTGTKPTGTEKDGQRWANISTTIDTTTAESTNLTLNSATSGILGTTAGDVVLNGFYGVNELVFGGNEVSLAAGESVNISITMSSSQYTNDGTYVGLSGLGLTYQVTPEPTTATLSLLALAGLCARRRRK